MSNSGNSNRKAFAQLTCILAGTIALAGCEAAETAPPQSGPAVSAAQRVYFHAGRTLTEGDEPVLEAVLRHPSLVMMADATVKGHLWLYTNADEREQALRHHRDLLATRARDPFSAAAGAVAATTDLVPPEFCFGPATLYFHINRGLPDRPVNSDQAGLEEFNDQTSSVHINFGTPSMRLFRHSNFSGQSLRLLPPPNSQSCASYNLTDFFFFCGPSCSTTFVSWNDQVSSLRFE